MIPLPQFVQYREVICTKHRETSKLINTTHQMDIIWNIIPRHKEFKLYSAAHGSISESTHPGTQNKSLQVQKD